MTEQHRSREIPHQTYDSKGKLGAITAAVLSVLAAFGSLLGGHAANTAILKQTQATDEWAYFQSQGTKTHLYEANRQMLLLYAEMQGKAHNSFVKHAANEFTTKSKEFEAGTKELSDEATKLENESAHDFERYIRYALSVACFEIGIVLASISILVGYQSLLISSLIAGGSGIGVLITSFLL